MRPFLLLALLAACAPTGSTDEVDTDTGDTVDSDTDGTVDTEVVDSDTDVVVGDDDDHDGTPAPADCDDGDASIHPGAEELCDDVDRDCDGDPTAGATDAQAWYVDADGDGYGTGAGQVACDAAGRVTDNTDCDDEDPGRYPNAELCDGRQNDCDAQWDPADEDGRVTFTAPGGVPLDYTGGLGTLMDGVYDLCPGTHVARLVADGVTVTIVGHPRGEDRVHVDGDGYHRVLTVTDADVTVSSVDLAHGTEVSGEGGLVRAEDSTLTLTDVAMSDGLAVDGGGLWLLRTDATLTRVSIHGWAHNGSGGGLSATEGNLRLEDVSITGKADLFGGCLLYDGHYAGGSFSASGLTLTNCLSSGGSSALGIGSDDELVSIEDLSITGATADFTAGTITSSNTRLAITRGTIADNTATEGTLYAVGGAITLDHVDFLRNTAGKGGAVWVTGATLTATGGTWSDNQTPGYGGIGGALYAVDTTVDLTSVVIEGNHATTGGGGAVLRESTGTLTDVTVSGNDTSVTNGYGGGLYLDDSDVTLVRTTVDHNVAHTGAGAYLVTGSTLTLLDHGSLSANDASGDDGGGAAAVEDTSVLTCGRSGSDEGASIVGNHATTAARGPGVWLRSRPASFVAYHCDLGASGAGTDNTATDAPTVSADVRSKDATEALGDDADATCTYQDGCP